MAIFLKSSTSVITFPTCIVNVIGIKMTINTIEATLVFKVNK